MRLGRRIFLGLLGIVLGAITFAVVHGYTEYRTAGSARTYVIENGIERDLTQEELVTVFLVGESLRALPSGVIAAVLLCVAALALAKRFRARSPWAAIVASALVGAAFGGLLALLVWVVLGGWGPVLLLPALGAGAVVGPITVAATSRSRPPQRDPPATGIHPPV